MIKVLAIISVIIAWIVLATITYGIMKYKDDNNEMEGYEALFMFLCIIGWNIFLVLIIGYFLLKSLSNLGEFVGGFLYGAIKKKED